MQPPAANDIRPSGQFQGGVTYPVGVYQVWMAFVDEDGLESDATMMGVALTAGAAFANLYVAGLPRSTDPQVKSRRFWVSASGGGAALENIDLFDNETRDIQLLPSVGGNAVDEPGLKFPAPRAKNITVGEGSLWLANLPDDSSGQNKVAVSSGLEIAHWPTDRQAILSSMDGNPITALTVQFGRIYVNKRDSIWQVSLAGVIGPASLPINSSIGLGGGVAAYDNVLYGAGGKGVHAFAGNDVDYRGLGLEGDYPSLDLSDNGMDAMIGSYWQPDSQYWLSVRRRNEVSNELVYVMQTDRQVAIQGKPQHPWARLLVPRHTSMSVVLDPGTRDPTLLLGTINGKILRYDKVLTIDGAVGFGTVFGIVASATTTSAVLSVVAPLDIGEGGLRGVDIEFLIAGAFQKRTIARNDGNTVYWLEPLAGIGLGTGFQIAAVTSHWSTGWLAPQQIGSFERVEHLDFEFIPQAGGIVLPPQVLVQWQSASGAVTTQRAFPATGAGQLTLDMSLGWSDEPMRIVTDKRGRYFRMRIFVTEPFRQYLITTFQMRFTETGQRGGRG
jgi:hypothetical protein